MLCRKAFSRNRYMPLAIHLSIVALFILLGVILSFGKGSWMIAGYNTSSRKEKARYDEKKLCKGVSRLMFALSACWLVIALSEVFKTMALLWVGLSLFLIVVIAALIYMNTGNRYMK